MLFYFTNLCFHMFWSPYPFCCHWCLSQGFYCCYKFHNKNQLGEERVHSSSQPSDQTPSVRRARNLEEGAEAESGRNAAHWIGPHGWSSLVSYTAQDHLQRVGTAHRGLGSSPTSIINQENVPQACPQANLVGAFSQLRFPLFKGL